MNFGQSQKKGKKKKMKTKVVVCTHQANSPAPEKVMHHIIGIQRETKEMQWIH